MLAIVDYGVGNLFSLRHSFAAIGVEAVVTSDPEVLRRAERIVLPGVGAFADAAAKLHESGLGEVVVEEARNGKPLLGICLGMQMLFDKSYEYGEHKGLGLIPGAVCPISGRIPEGYKIPHIGWNALTFPQQNPLFKYISEGDHVYFVHSYCMPDISGAWTAATCEYGVPFTAAVCRGNVMATQFHPEKSGDAGLRMLRRFALWTGKEGAAC